jgi:cell migration-inducing and hyaluronan-binding protein
MFDRNAGPDGTFGVTGSSHIARENPADGNSPSIESVIEDFTGYKNRNGGIWSRGEMKVFKDLKLADNAVGYTHASGSIGRDPFTSRVIDSLFVGETDNIGNPRTPEEIAYGRSLPKAVADFPIRGYEFYDYIHSVENSTFVNFADNDTRRTGAISYLLYTSFGMSVENSVEGAKFINAKPVYFPPRERKWANDFGGSTAYTSATIHDLDGSVGGVPDSYIVIDNGIASDEEACEIKPSWGAAVCQGDFGRVRIGGGGDGGFRGFGGRGEAAGPGAVAGGGGAAAGPGAAVGRGGAPGAGAPAGPGGGFGGFGGFGGGAAADPVILSRNGREFEYGGGQTTIRSGAEVKVDTARESVSLSLTAMDNGSWVVFELPGFTTAAEGAEQASLAALRNAGDTSYYKDGDTLWVKLVVANAGDQGGPGGLGGGTSIDVSR